MMIGALLAASAVASSAAELTLFGEPLRTADRAHMLSAAKAGGAKLLKSSAASDVFDASAMGLPGAQKLEIAYLNGQVVMAQYKLEKNSPTDERFRKMLVAKYGMPQPVDDAFRGDKAQQFAQEYVGDGKYRWAFDNNMELVFTKEFFGDRYLTYVNKTAQAKVQRMLDAAEQKGAARAAKSKTDLF